jgi:hypothetical protein
MTSATELEGFYTTHHQLGLPPENGVQPVATYNMPCHIQLTATSLVGKNNTNNNSTGAAEHTEQHAIQLAEAYAASWERSEKDSRYNTPECDGADMEECSTTDDDDDTAEYAPARAARERNPNKCTPRIPQRQRTRATEMDGAEAHIGEIIYVSTPLPTPGSWQHIQDGQTCSNAFNTQATHGMVCKHRASKCAGSAGYASMPLAPNSTSKDYTPRGATNGHSKRYRGTTRVHGVRACIRQRHALCPTSHVRTYRIC